MVIQNQTRGIQHYFQRQYGSKAALKSMPHITIYPPFLLPSRDLDRLHKRLADFAQQFMPIPVWFSGFGAFRDQVIFIKIIKTSPLMLAQSGLSSLLQKTFEIYNPSFQQRQFKPHLTLAFRDLKPDAFHQAWPKFR